MLKVKEVSFEYSKNKTVLEGFSFNLKPGETLCLMGESGSGKSTLLKLIYGLLDTKKGSIYWNETQVLGPKFNLVPGFENFKYVAQDFDLMPYTSVSENIKKFLSRFYPEESEARTQELLEVIEMAAFANTKVKNLSGGQQQRVAIARAIAKEPELLLLDEPFSQIDNFKKNSLRRKLFSYLKEKNIACIIATHDGNDALSFADKMIVINNHKIIAKGSPKEIYNNPKNLNTASLFDDINQLNINGKIILLYPHQIKKVDKSNYIATIIKSYFKGFYWLIEAEISNQKVFFINNSKIENNTKCFINFEVSI